MHRVILSGGLDSTAVLAGVRAVHPAADVKAVTYDYGQRHGPRERRAATEVATHYDVELSVVDLRGLLGTAGGGALMGDGTVPHGRYDDPSMSATVVPGRNLFLIAATVARSLPGDLVYVGVHAGDHPIYPDCRPEFITALDAATRAAYQVALVAPYLHAAKVTIVADADAMGAPLGMTWSCYEGGWHHCGRCGTCVERAEAFALAGVADPTHYLTAPDWSAAS